MGGYRMSEVIVITSGKGGVGKTTLCANLGAAFARMEKKCVVVDTDLGLRNLDVVMGLENRIVYNLIDVAEGNCRLKQALVRDKHYPGLYLLPAAQTRDKSAITPQQLIKLTDDLRAHFEYILIDCPAGIEQGFQNAVAPGRQGHCSDHTGGFGHTGCRSDHRSSGSCTDEKDGNGDQPYSSCYGGQR